MQNRILSALFIGLFLLSSNLNGLAQTAPKVIDDADHVIKQKTFYTAKGFNKADRYKPVNLGPVLDETYIDAHDVATLGDLNDAFELRKAYLPDQWPEKYDLHNARFVILQFSDGAEMPAIQTPDGTFFSFLTEEGYLSCDIKQVETKADGSQKVIYMTAEMFREE